MGDVEGAVKAALDGISSVGDDTRRFSQQESAEFYEAIADECVERANMIRGEMDDDDG